MRLKAFSSIGGLRIYGKSDPKGPDIFMVAVHPDDLSDLAVALINQANTDASPELIAKCRELVGYADEHLGVTFKPRGLTAIERHFIKHCEDNAGESKRPHETELEYLQRLEADYGGE